MAAVIDFSCPACKTKFRVGDETAGKKVKCRKCGARLRLVGPGRADLLPPKAGVAGNAGGIEVAEGEKKTVDPLFAPVGAINLGSSPASHPPATEDGFQEIVEPPPLPAPLAGPAPSDAAGAPTATGIHAISEKRPPRWMGALFLLIGLGLLAGGGFWIWKTIGFTGRAERAPGAVVEMVEKQGSGSDSDGPTWAPKVKFRTAGGMEIEFVSGVSSTPPSYTPGDAVEVLYDPMNPRDATIDSFVQLWLFPVLLPVLGLVFGAAGVFLILKSRTG